MRIKYTKHAASDIEYWRKKDKQIYKRIRCLLDDILEHPYEGIGKPEPLRHGLRGKWSRRITREHRLVYEVVDHAVIIHQCRYHY